MIKRFCYSAFLLSLALVLIACQLAPGVSKQPAEPTSLASASHETDIPTEKASQSEEADPVEKQATEKPAPDLAALGKPQQSQAAEIRPKEMRTMLTHLSSFIGFQVLDGNGDKLGVASDYIVNTCETYIIYILMEPVASLQVAPGNRFVIPFEAVTINSGVLDAKNKAIHLRLIPEQFLDAPTFPDGQELTPTDWEGVARDFWSKPVRIGKLATSCNVPGGPVYKVAYATQLLGVELYDEQNNVLGVVQEAILEPESGKISSYIVKPVKGNGLVMVHLRAVNIPKEALLPGATLTLVLLTDPNVFWDALRITNVDEADDFALQSKMREYWDR